jgi:ferredoxin
VKATIDDTRCSGHGRCYSVAPEVFAADDLGYGTVRGPELPSELAPAARLGRDSCPERAITVEE